MKKFRLMLPLIMITCLVFSVSCASRELPVMETYYETEYRTEEYTSMEEHLTTHSTDLFKVEGRSPLVEYFFLFRCDGKTLHFSNPREQMQFQLAQFRVATWDEVDVAPTGQNHRIRVSVSTKSGSATTYSGADQPIAVGLMTGWIGPGSTDEFAGALNVARAWGFTAHILTLTELLARTGVIFPPSVWEGVRPTGGLAATAKFNTMMTTAYSIPTGVWITLTGYEAEIIRKLSVAGYLPERLNPVKEHIVASPERQVEFTFGEMGMTSFTTQPLIYVVSLPYKASCDLTMQLDYVWDHVESVQVIKQRQVPYQVEKQRTVMQMKRVPFWEVIFAK